MRHDDRELAAAAQDPGVSPPSAPRLDPAVAIALGPILAQAVHASRAPVLVTDAELDLPGPRIVYVNPAFERITRHAAADLLGETPRCLQGPATDRSVLDRLRADLTAGRDFEGESVNYRADGEPYINSWRVSPILDGTGTITHWAAVQADVTEERLRGRDEHRVVADLQQRLLPRVPDSVGDLDFCARYEPAASSVGLGGDWYDVVHRPDGACALVVGDVAGHGPDAVASMGRLRWSVHALLAAGTPLPTVVDVTSSLGADDGTYATLAVVVIDADRRVEVVTCGNPPVLVLRADGGREAWSTPNPILGFTDGPPTEVCTDALGTGDVLVLVTDGVLDGGRYDGDIAEVLLGRLAAAPEGADLDALIDAVGAGAAGLDDRSTLAARVVARPSGA